MGSQQFYGRMGGTDRILPPKRGARLRDSLGARWRARAVLWLSSDLPDHFMALMYSPKIKIRKQKEA